MKASEGFKDFVCMSSEGRELRVQVVESNFFIDSVCLDRQNFVASYFFLFFLHGCVMSMHSQIHSIRMEGSLDYSSPPPRTKKIHLALRRGGMRAI